MLPIYQYLLEDTESTDTDHFWGQGKYEGGPGCGVLHQMLHVKDRWLHELWRQVLQILWCVGSVLISPMFDKHMSVIDSPVRDIGPLEVNP